MQRRILSDDKARGRKITQKVTSHRLFIAIFPPEEWLRYFRDVLREFDKEKRNLRPIPNDQLHITLKFIGAEVSTQSKDMILEEIQRHKGNFPKPELKIARVQFGFRYQDDPRVLMAALEESPELNDLANIVHGLVRGLRLYDTIRWKEKSNYDFHVSIARLKGAATRSSGKEIRNIVQKVNIEIPKSFIAEEIYLMESDLNFATPVYRKLAQIKL
jgi:2'-5' RNA ligase